MKAIEAMAKAISAVDVSKPGWNEDAARAALKALAEMELSEEIIRKGSESIDWGGEFCEDAETLFRAILRRMIEEEPTGDDEVEATS